MGRLSRLESRRAPRRRAPHGFHQASAPWSRPGDPRPSRRDLSGTGFEPGSLRSRARQARSASRRRSHRHPIGGRGGDHASRGLDQSQGRVGSRGAPGLLRGDPADDAVEGVAGGPTRRARHRRAQSLPRPGAFGLSRELSGVPLLPIGTLYDPFITRGLDALYHALYAGGKFIAVATPSGVSLSPEGGAHQSVITPGIGVALPAIAYYEPTFALEVEWILLHALASLLDRDHGESLYLRLSTKPVDQSQAPAPSREYRERVLRGGYRLVDARGESGWDAESNAVHLFAAGVMVPEAVEAARLLRAENIFASVFAVTSPDKLYRGLRDPRPYLEDLVTPDEEDVPIVSVLDGHSHALSFLGSALAVPQMSLGVDNFGQSGARRDLYAHYGIDPSAIAKAARTLLGRVR